MPIELIPAGRSIRFEPGYDKRAESTPGKTYGVHGMDIVFFLRGEEGAIQFKMSTGWVPWEPRPVSDRPELWGARYHQNDRLAGYPMAVDLGYHSNRPLYEGAYLLSNECPYIGGPCYYDGSGLSAEPVMVALIYDGEEAVWQLLVDYYRATFLERVPA